MLNGTVRDVYDWGQIDFFIVFSEDYEEVTGGGDWFYFKNGSLDTSFYIGGFRPYGPLGEA